MDLPDKASATPPAASPPVASISPAPTPARPTSPAPAGAGPIARVAADPDLGGLGAPSQSARPRAGTDRTRPSSEPDRIAVAFEAINVLANCIDQTIRELRRGTAAQWRFVQDELTRARRLVAPPRPTPIEGPSRDEGPASQPPPEPTPDDGLGSAP